MNNFKPVIILEPDDRRRPVLYADIPVPFLKVPAGEEGGPGGLPNLLKEEKEEEEMEGKRRDEKEMQDSMVVEEGMLVPLPLVSFPCSSCFKVIFSKKKLTKDEKKT